MTATDATLQRIVEINRRRLGLDPADSKGDRMFSEASGASERLCIYGRMRPGGPDAHLLEPLGGSWSEGTFPGYLQDGACSIDQCPGLAWTPTGERNRGYILTSAKVDDLWPSLDAKEEGTGLVRLLTPAHLDDGSDVVANIYVSRDASQTQLLMLDGMNVHDDADFRP